MKVILVSILTLTICHRTLSNEVPAGTVCGNNYNIFYGYCNCQSAQKLTPVILSDYVVHQGFSAYRLHTDSGLTWNETRHACLNERAHLAVITSSAEDKILSDMQNAKKLEYVWLGFHDQYKKNDWVSVSDQQMDSIGYIHWRVGEPNSVGNERCVCNTNNSMNDINYNSKFASFCKIDLSQ